MMPDASVRVGDPRLCCVVITGTRDPAYGPARRRYPLVRAARDSCHLTLGQPGVVLVHLAVVLCAANSLAGLRHLPGILWVQHLLQRVPVAGVGALPELLGRCAIPRLSHQLPL